MRINGSNFYPTAPRLHLHLRPCDGTDGCYDAAAFSSRLCEELATWIDFGLRDRQGRCVGKPAPACRVPPVDVREVLREAARKADENERQQASERASSYNAWVGTYSEQLERLLSEANIGDPPPGHLV